MDATIKALSGLVDYEIADVTAAATFAWPRPISISVVP